MFLIVKTTSNALCTASDHQPASGTLAVLDPLALDRCARIFRAMGEPARLRLVSRLAHAPACVGDLASLENESVTTISQRLRVLRADHIVERRREGKHVIYFLADQHMFDLVASGLAHASES